MKRDWRLLAAAACVLANLAATLLFLNAMTYQFIACQANAIPRFCEQSVPEIVWGWLAVICTGLAIALLVWAYFRPAK